MAHLDSNKFESNKLISDIINSFTSETTYLSSSLVRTDALMAHLDSNKFENSAPTYNIVLENN